VNKKSGNLSEALDRIRGAVEDLKKSVDAKNAKPPEPPEPPEPIVVPPSKPLYRITLNEFIPALVIGSGYGGAVAALRLAEEGIPTVVLERGKRWPITPKQDTFATFEKPDGRAAWLSDHTVWPPVLPPVPVDKFVGNFETIKGEGITVFNGAGVGGGSLINNAILIQPRRELFQRVFPKAIDFDEMDQVYYPRVREIIKPSPIPDDVLNTPFYESTRINSEQYKRAGFPVRPIDLAIDWDIVREEIAGKKKPSAIDGQSWGGYNSGAKKSVDQNYLALAEATGVVEVLPLHVVIDIEESPLGGYLVSANRIDEHGDILEKRNFICKFLFLAAGSTGTTSLLVRAKAKGTLPRLNKFVGQEWASNGDFVFLRAGLPITNPGQGGPAGNVIVEDVGNPFGPVSLVEAVTPKPAVAHLPPGASFYIVMGAPPALGAFRFDSATDSVILNWPASDPRLANLASAAQRTAQTLNEKNTDTATLVLDPSGTGHPLGGAALGKVCDWFGRVKRYPGLYVVDGAFIPGWTGIVNPALTIAALAERSMERIIERDILSGR